MGGRGKDFQEQLKRHMNKTKEGWDQGWEVGMARVGGSCVCGKMQTTVLEKQ